MLDRLLALIGILNIIVAGAMLIERLITYRKGMPHKAEYEAAIREWFKNERPPTKMPFWAEERVQFIEPTTKEEKFAAAKNISFTKWIFICLSAWRSR